MRFTLPLNFHIYKYLSGVMWELGSQMPAIPPSTGIPNNRCWLEKKWRKKEKKKKVVSLDGGALDASGVVVQSEVMCKETSGHPRIHLL